MKRNLLLIGLCFLLTGCGKLETKEITIEAGNPVPENVMDYVDDSSNVSEEELTIDTSTIDTSVIGNYTAILTYNNKEYEVPVAVVDTVAPTAELKDDYSVIQPGTFTAADYVKNIDDATETSVKFANIERRGDLFVMTEDELKENANSGETEVPDLEGIELSETTDIEEDGIYDVEIIVQDAAENTIAFIYTMYVDGTAPVIDAEDWTVTVNQESTDIYIDHTVIKYNDNLNGDIFYWDTSKSEYTPHDDNTESLGIYDVHISAYDMAGNYAEKDVTLTVVNEYYLNQEMAYVNNLLQNSTTTQPTTIADGFNRSKAEEAFALVNQQRVANGLSELVWDESLYEYACERAKEIVTNWSHIRPSGVLSSDELLNTLCPNGAGENISRYGSSPSDTVNSWMTSSGHRATILDSRFNYGVMACYISNGKYYYVNLFKA